MALDSREPLSGSGRDGSRKVSTDVLPTELQSFTFVPALKKLPIKNRILLRGQSREPPATSTEQCSGGQEADQSMSDGVFRAEIVFIGDSDEGDTRAVPDELSVKGEVPAQQYKIKTGYKALAAIPTNTILLEQQAIDDHVENQESPGEKADNGEESRPEICSPAQLRQESEELYAAIDEVLENTMPTRRSRSVPVTLMKPLSPEPSKPFTLLPRPVGRETKYPVASCPGLAGTRGMEGGMNPPKGTQVPEKSGEASAGTRTPILQTTEEDGSDIQAALAGSSEYPGTLFSMLHANQNETHI